MILDEQQVDERLKSPDNLVNRFGIRPMPDSSKGPSTPAPKEAEFPSTDGRAWTRRVDTIKSARLGNNLALFARMTERVESLPVSQVRSLLPAGDRLSEQPAIIDENEAIVEQTENHIRDRAHEVINRVLDHLTDDKMAASNGVQLAGIAANISKVAANVTSKGHIGDGVKLIVYAPQLRQEKQYETVDIVTQ